MVFFCNVFCLMNIVIQCCRMSCSIVILSSGDNRITQAGTQPGMTNFLHFLFRKLLRRLYRGRVV